MPSPRPIPAHTGRRRPGALAVALVALIAVAVVACGPNAASPAGDGAILVESTATECRLSATTATSGPVAFRVTNAGDEVTEFYILADDGQRVISEVEDVGPGLARDLVVQLEPGTYRTACKPGMVGDGITGVFTVTD